MKRNAMNGWCCFFALGMLTVNVLLPVKSQTSQASLVQSIQNLMDTKLSTYGIKGVGVTIIMPDSNTYSLTSGYATSPGDPVDTVRKWHWASCTKVLNGFIVLQLIEQGMLGIDDPIGMYLDTDTIPNLDGAITIKRLLRHTSGLNEVWSESVTPALWSAVWGNRDSVWQYSQVLKYIPSPTGLTTHKYTNTNAYVISSLIEAITGKGLETVYQERIFGPLAMSQSSFTAGKSFNMATINGVWNGNENRSSWSHTSYLSSRGGNSGLVTSTRDIATFYRAYYKDALLSKATMDSLRVPSFGSRYNPVNLNGMSVFQSYGYETEIMELVLANHDTVWGYGHAGNGINNGLCFYLPEQQVTLALALNDFTNQGIGSMIAMFLDIVVEVYNAGTIATGVEQEAYAQPTSFELLSAYPNPFNPSTTIRYNLPTESRVRMTIHDPLGREVAILVDGVNESGNLGMTWNAGGMASGMYFVRLEAVSQVNPNSRFMQTRKIVILK